MPAHSVTPLVVVKAEVLVLRVANAHGTARGENGLDLRRIVLHRVRDTNTSFVDSQRFVISFAENQSLPFFEFRSQQEHRI